jgi:hypothetical protein
MEKTITLEDIRKMKLQLELKESQIKALDAEKSKIAAEAETIKIQIKIGEMELGIQTEETKSMEADPPVEPREEKIEAIRKKKWSEMVEEEEEEQKKKPKFTSKFDQTPFNNRFTKPETITKKEFFELVNIIRPHVNDSTKNETFYTIDYSRLGSKINFLPGASAEIVYKYFCAGLIKNIYPSQDLKEISLFPPALKEKINLYQTRASKHQNIFLSFYSSPMDWDEEKTYSPYHIILMGRVSKGFEIRKTPTRRPIYDSEEPIMEERIENLKNVFYEMRKINLDTKIRVNYFSSKIFLFTRIPQAISEEYTQKVIKYRTPFSCGGIDASLRTQQLFCKKLNQQGIEDHMCQLCEKDKKEDKKESKREDM